MNIDTMLAGVLHAAGDLRLQTVPISKPGKNEVCIQMELLGICGSDVSLYKGHRSNTPFPLIIGHEGIGRVVEYGPSVNHLSIGQRVVIEPNFPCGQCDLCWSGRSNICRNKRIFGVLEAGCFAEYACVPAQFVHAIPDSITDEDAVLIEPLAVALHALYTAPARPGDTLTVVGLGAIGLLLTQLACRMGYRVLVLDKMVTKVEIAKKWGAIPLPQDATEAQLTSSWGDAKVSAIFECAGVATVLSTCIAAAPRGATVVVVGLAGQTSVLTEFQLARQGIQVLSSIIYQHPIDFQRVIRLLDMGFIHPSEIIGARYDFGALEQGMEMACSGVWGKVVLEFEN